MPSWRGTAVRVALRSAQKTTPLENDLSRNLQNPVVQRLVGICAEIRRGRKRAGRGDEVEFAVAHVRSEEIRLVERIESVQRQVEVDPLAIQRDGFGHAQIVVGY